MKYFIDTEFIEGFHQPKFLGIPIGKKRHFIDLISIGIVAEDGREFYAISNEFNPKDADKWVRDNVIFPIELDLFKKLTHEERNKLVVGKGDKAVTNVINKFGKSNKQIKQGIIDFINSEPINVTKTSTGAILTSYYPTPEFYAYYADYDWVLFCSLFGRMIDLPKGFPMMCFDLKQTLDEKANAMKEISLKTFTYSEKNAPIVHSRMEDISSMSLNNKLEFIKLQKLYPKQTDEHNALADAKWNYELYKFLKTI